MVGDGFNLHLQYIAHSNLSVLGLISNYNSVKVSDFEQKQKFVRVPLNPVIPVSRQLFLYMYSV